MANVDKVRKALERCDPQALTTGNAQATTRPVLTLMTGLSGKQVKRALDELGMGYMNMSCVNEKETV